MPAKPIPTRAALHSHGSPLLSLVPACSSTRHFRQPWNGGKGEKNWRDRNGGEQKEREGERLTNAAEPRPARKAAAEPPFSSSLFFLLGAVNARACVLFPVVEERLLCSLARGRQNTRREEAGVELFHSLFSDCSVSLSLEQLTNGRPKTKKRKKTATHPLREATPAGAHCEGN